MVSHKIEKVIEGLVVLIADSNAYTRRLTRQMLATIGVKSVYQVATASLRSTHCPPSRLT